MNIKPDSELHVGTAHASAMTGLSKARLNHMIAVGTYSESPLTRQAVERKFRLQDLVVLSVFADALRAGMSHTAANSCAQGARGVLRTDPSVDTLVIGEMRTDEDDMSATMVYGTPEKFDMFKLTYRGRPLAAVRTIPLATMAARLKAEMQQIAATRPPQAFGSGPRPKRRPRLQAAS